MDVAQFWRLIEDSKMESDGNTEQQVQLLQDRLAQFESNEIIEFDKLLLRQRFDAYRWDLWGAADVINGGCSDDCFEYFRGWLIAQGESVFRNALQDPDSLADVVAPDVEFIECEEMNYVALEAYVSRKGTEMADRDEPYPDIIGQKWAENDLPTLYPRLCAIFRCK